MLSSLPEMGGVEHVQRTEGAFGSRHVPNAPSLLPAAENTCRSSGAVGYWAVGVEGVAPWE
jgi:hypothetical protein|eukprot:7386187-Prymnesium_polylepis.1